MSQEFLRPILLLACMLAAAGSAFAQGCVVTRGAGMASEHFLLNGSSEESSIFFGDDATETDNSFSWDRLVATAAYRSLHSHRHFVGSEEQHERREEGSQVINNSDFVDVALNYTFTPRLSTTLTLPFVRHDRSQVLRANDAHRTVLRRFHTQSDGLGDLRLTGNLWVRDPRQARRSNLLIGVGIDAPTGKKAVRDDFETYNAATGSFSTERRTVDQSIQPGDGGWAYLVDLYGFVRLSDRALVYANGSYALTPQETSGVPTFRSNPFESEMSIADSYLFRTGFEYLLTPRFGTLTLSLGARIEGVPVHDVVGGSNGFRRPGYAVSVEPGLAARIGSWSANLYVPIAIRRDRQRSVADRQWTQASGVFRAGDAAFADATVMMSLSKRFSAPRRSLE